MSDLKLDSQMTLKERARQEVKKEQDDINKKRYKKLFTQLAHAKQVVSNLEREIEDLDIELE